MTQENPEPAEGQVPAGDYEPVYESDPEEATLSVDSIKSVQEVAQEVVAGHWGRGHRCKERLRAAGYDVRAISDEVARIFNQ